MFIKNLTKILLICLLILFNGCVSVRSIQIKDEYIKAKTKSVSEWTVENCDAVINYYAQTNYRELRNAEEIYKVSDDNVLIRAIPLNEDVLSAKVRKKIINQRIDKRYFKQLLHEEFNRYLYLNVDTTGNSLRKIDRKNIKYSFELFIENNTSPYHPIELEDGYSCMFLENNEGRFSRVVEVVSDYASEDIYLNDYLHVIVKFDCKDDKGKYLFNGNDPSYKLIFNGFQKKPIILKW